VIFFGYLGLALLVGVSSALLVVVASRASAGVRLVMRCLRWGFATGAVTGAVFGASVTLVGTLRGDPWSTVGLMVGDAVVGAIIGAVVALLPTVIGTVFVTDLLRHRHPHPASEESVRSDLTAAFGVEVAVLDVIVLVVVLASGAGVGSAAVALAGIAAGNGCVLLMLWRARRSIARLWLAVASS
jgi:hypothetical protein